MMNRTTLACLVLVLSIGCSASPTAPISSTVIPTVFNTAVNITGVALTRAPLRIEFTGNYPWRDVNGNLKAASDPHILVRADLGGIPTNDGGVALQTYLNGTWFPREFRDADGARTGFALIHIISFSPTDVQWELRTSDDPIVQWW